MAHALVTGGSGFIGRHVVAELVRTGWQVRCLVRHTSQVDHLIHPRVELRQGSLHSPGDLSNAVHDVDAVFHLAGLANAVSTRQLFETNATACGVLADACCRAPTPPLFLYLSSLAAAGPAPNRQAVRQATDPVAPISDYGRSKQQGEIELQKRSQDLPCTIIRPGIVFGSHDRNMLLMFRAIHRYGVHATVGYRTPPLSLIHVADLVQLMLAATARGERVESANQNTGCYFAADDREFPNYAELGQKLATALDRRVFVWPLWRWVGRSVAGVCQLASSLRGQSSQINLDKVREATAPSWACSAAKAREELAFRPAESLDAALKRTADWYLEQEWL